MGLREAGRGAVRERLRPEIGAWCRSPDAPSEMPRSSASTMCRGLAGSGMDCSCGADREAGIEAQRAGLVKRRSRRRIARSTPRRAQAADPRDAALDGTEENTDEPGSPRMTRIGAQRSPIDRETDDRSGLPSVDPCHPAPRCRLPAYAESVPIRVSQTPLPARKIKNVIASVAKQSSLQCGGTGLLRYARNDRRGKRFGQSCAWPCRMRGGGETKKCGPSKMSVAADELYHPYSFLKERIGDQRRE